MAKATIPHSPLARLVSKHTLCEGIAHLGYEEITHLGYVLGLAPLVQSDQSSSRVLSETFPSQSGPAFLLPPSAVLSVWTGVMRFPRELPLLEVSAGLGGVASCL